MHPGRSPLSEVVRPALWRGHRATTAHLTMSAFSAQLASGPQSCPTTARYHNREWAEKMCWLGLRPTRTGHREGPMTGQSMTHCIIPGGRFERALGKLRAMLPALTWFDVDAAEVLPKGLRGSDLMAAPLSGRRTVYHHQRVQHHAARPGSAALRSRPRARGAVGRAHRPHGLRHLQPILDHAPHRAPSIFWPCHCRRARGQGRA
jgi:hypothetical protein